MTYEAIMENGDLNRANTVCSLGGRSMNKERPTQIGLKVIMLGVPMSRYYHVHMFAGP